MWIELPSNSTRKLQRRVTDDKGKEKTHAAVFNHNGRAEVTKVFGDLLLKEIPTLKAVKDGGPPPKVEEDKKATVTEESTDGE